jgi:uncharacterized membrane protein YccC
MAYRDDYESLVARYEVLEAENASLKQRIAEMASEKDKRDKKSSHLLERIRQKVDEPPSAFLVGAVCTLALMFCILIVVTILVRELG